VDEDRSSYTFRKDLHKPEEFVLQRSEVLFMAEKNPSGLSGEAGTDFVSLKWLPPYDPVKVYRVYTRANRKSEYVLAGETSRKEIVLRKLPSNTEYLIIVRSVDRDGYESSPSNELKISTANIPPYAPGNVKQDKTSAGDTVLSWDAATDPDGTVAGYRIYVLNDGEAKLAGETKKTTYSVKAGTPYKKLIVRAVDDRKAESGSAMGKAASARSWSASACGAYFLPQGSFADMAGNGFGGMLEVENAPLNYNDFCYGLQAGGAMLAGADFDDQGRKGKSFTLIPMSVYAGYALSLGDLFRISPRVGLGVIYSMSEYTTQNPVTAELEDGSSSGVDAWGWTGLVLDITPADSFFIRAGAQYGMVFADTKLPFALVTIGAGLRF